MTIADFDMDEPVVLGLEPLTWYRLVELQIDLLRNHVDELEARIGESLKAYESKKVATYVEHDNEMYPIVILEEHRGIEAPPSELEEIFLYYFPNLQRRSTLIVLFSFLENQFDQLCKLFASTQGLNIVHTDLSGKGIDRSRLYLKKVVCLSLNENSRVWQEIKRIQKVRNVVVHNDAKLVDRDTIRYVSEANYLALASESHYSHDADEVNILGGYLTHVLETFNSHCREVDTAIQALLSPTSQRGVAGS
jgi:hypothetical protein